VTMADANSEQEVTKALAAEVFARESLTRVQEAHMKATEAYMNSTSVRKRPDETRED